jgi:hypothetical protein
MHTLFNRSSPPVKEPLQMTCLYDRSKKVDFVAEWSYMIQNGKNNNDCSGSLADFLIGFNKK